MNCSESKLAATFGVALNLHHIHHVFSLCTQSLILLGQVVHENRQSLGKSKNDKSGEPSLNMT